jgi:hypothetical protein
MIKEIKDFLCSTVLGPFPYFWEEKDLVSSPDDKPEFRYCLWVTPKRFAPSILIKLSRNSREGFDDLRKEWETRIQELIK